MQFTVFVQAAILAMVGLGVNTLTVYDRAELMQLKEALRSQLDEIEAQTIEDRETAPIESFAERDDQPTPQLLDSTSGSSDGTNTVCPTCSSDAICCRHGDTFKCCSKIYVGKDQQIEFDTKNNTVTLYHHNGSTHVLDFKKGILTVHDPKNNACYIAAGLDFTLDDVKAVVAGNASADNKAIQPHYYEDLKLSPVEDHSILPEAHQVKCRGKHVSWHKASTPPATTVQNSREISIDNTKRGFWSDVWDGVVAGASSEVGTIIVDAAVAALI
jgi:hypothetical protein